MIVYFIVTSEKHCQFGSLEPKSLKNYIACFS